MKKIKKIVTISGGKDSTACAIWAINTYPKEELSFIFCDTGWESQKTYEYLEYLEGALDIYIQILKPSRYKNFEDMITQKGRFPSTKARFCTEELKIKPMIDWILGQKEDLFIIQGIRANESRKRADMNSLDDYFLYYNTPYGYTKGKPKYHKYRKKDVLNREQEFATGVYRPIFNWTAKDVFDYHNKHGIEPNPLYKMGFSRVGCFPCVMCNQAEVRLIAQQFPERIKQIEAIEEREGTTFFPPGFIPERFANKQVTTSKGAIKHVPTVTDVTKYVQDDPNQYNLFPQPKNACQSIYNLCE